MHKAYAIPLSGIFVLSMLAGCSLDSGAAAVSAAQIKAREAQNGKQLKSDIEKQLAASQAQRAMQLESAEQKQ